MLLYHKYRGFKAFKEQPGDSARRFIWILNTAPLLCFPLCTILSYWLLAGSPQVLTAGEGLWLTEQQLDILHLPYTIHIHATYIPRSYCMYFTAYAQGTVSHVKIQSCQEVNNLSLFFSSVHLLLSLFLSYHMWQSFVPRCNTAEHLRLMPQKSMLTKTELSFPPWYRLQCQKVCGSLGMNWFSRSFLF